MYFLATFGGLAAAIRLIDSPYKVTVTPVSITAGRISEPARAPMSDVDDGRSANVPIERGGGAAVTPSSITSDGPSFLPARRRLRQISRSRSIRRMGRRLSVPPSPRGTTGDRLMCAPTNMTAHRISPGRSGRSASARAMSRLRRD